MTRFVGCIDLHEGKVKQIVGGTLSATGAGLQTNFVAEQPPEHFAKMYRDNHVVNSHVIKLGHGNDDAARAALAAWPGKLQVGGGITANNAAQWIEAGAEKVIVTSYLFPDGKFSKERLLALEEAVGNSRLTIDLSCRKRENGQWVVAMDRWQRLTDFVLSKSSLAELSEHCSEFLVHAADVEGLCGGIDEQLVELLPQWTSIPVTYAGGAHRLEDLDLVAALSNGQVNLTLGSALDIFGGTRIKFADAVKWNEQNGSQLNRMTS